MAYQIEDQNGNQPQSAQLWDEIIAAHEKDQASVEWDGDTVSIMEVQKNDSCTLIKVHIEG